ncbi:Panacea domain-containing protein [Arenicella xantha]|uniref:Uncharacterized protein DUF4065 n=1 Tax=Arenicella xantha TaxID=644221 RepID=A0A395JMX5_9GAMM|nr:Panacea domain-containing protein [Arenicella xantha]RBP52990.1 uncharacterized protein DUF4065 [Arenicella xantha]
MNNIQKESISRTLEAFAYIAKRAPTHKRNMYNVLKVFYLADKLHMERYGRFIFDDTYSAMQRGPVPSAAYDLIKAIKAGSELPLSIESPVRFVEEHVLRAEREADEDLFSGSDLLCLDEVIALSETEDLGELSHDSAWEATQRNQLIPVEAILSTLQNSDALINLNQNRYN